MLQADPQGVNPDSREASKDIPDYYFRDMTFKTQKYTVCLRLPDGGGEETTERPERSWPRFAFGKKLWNF